MESLLALVITFEGFSPVLYPDGDLKSIGYGHQVQPEYEFRYEGGITKGEAWELLIYDLVEVQREVSMLVEVGLNKHQIDALTSLAYNIGTGALARSKGLELINSGRIIDGATELFHHKKGFVKAGGKILKGLQRRRAAELELFFKPDYSFL